MIDFDFTNDNRVKNALKKVKHQMDIGRFSIVWGIKSYSCFLYRSFYCYERMYGFLGRKKVRYVNLKDYWISYVIFGCLMFCYVFSHMQRWYYSSLDLWQLGTGNILGVVHRFKKFTYNKQSIALSNLVDELYHKQSNLIHSLHISIWIGVQFMITDRQLVKENLLK